MKRKSRLRLVPPGALKGYLGPRTVDPRVTYATYFPKGKRYPIRGKKEQGDATPRR